MFSDDLFTSLFDYSTPTAQHGPLISALMAPAAWLFPDATIGLRYVIAFIGVATIFGFATAGRLLAGERAGVIATSIAAVLTDLWIRDGLVVAEPLAAALAMKMMRKRRSISRTRLID